MSSPICGYFKHNVGTEGIKNKLPENAYGSHGAKAMTSIVPHNVWNFNFLQNRLHGIKRTYFGEFFIFRNISLLIWCENESHLYKKIFVPFMEKVLWMIEYVKNGLRKWTMLHGLRFADADINQIKSFFWEWSTLYDSNNCNYPQHPKQIKY